MVFMSRRICPSGLLIALLTASLVGASTSLAGGGFNPSGPTVLLERGKHWTYSVYRSGHQRCLDLEVRSGRGGSCPRLGRKQEFSMSLDHGSGPIRRTKLTVFTIEAPLKDRRVHLDLYHHRDRDIYLRRLGARRARRAGVRDDFRYAAFGVRGCESLRSPATVYRAGGEQSGDDSSIILGNECRGQKGIISLGGGGWSPWRVSIAVAVLLLAAALAYRGVGRFRAARAAR